MSRPDFQTPIEGKELDKQTVSELLEKGHVLSIQENQSHKLEMVTGGMVVDAPKDQVFRVLTDYESFSDFMPSTTYCKVVNRTEDYIDIVFRLELKVAVIKIKTEYTNRHWLVSDSEIRFALLQTNGSKLKDSYGAWQLYELDGGKKTAVFYSNYADIGNLSWVLKKAFEVEPSLDMSIQASSAVMVLKAIKMRVEDPTFSPNKNRKLAIF